jgi:hypothetical protein
MRRLAAAVAGAGMLFGGIASAGQLGPTEHDIADAPADGVFQPTSHFEFSEGSLAGLERQWRSRDLDDSTQALRFRGPQPTSSIFFAAEAPSPVGAGDPGVPTIDGIAAAPWMTRLPVASELLIASDLPQIGPSATLILDRTRPSARIVGLDQGAAASLPEPGTWVMLLLGFGVIGLLLRANIIANRELAELQPEEA